jgi:hypothetical protein
MDTGDQTRSDIPFFDRCDIGLQAREIAYTGIGLGILGFQRAQVLRREYQPAIEEFWTQIRTHLR